MPTWSNTQEVSNHVGLLFNGPLGAAELSFNQSSDNF